MEAPRSVFAGAWIAVVECTIGLGYGVFLMIRDFQGYEDPGAVISGWGTALWFYFIFGAVLAGAVFLLMGNRWGRGPAWPSTCSPRAPSHWGWSPRCSR